MGNKGRKSLYKNVENKVGIEFLGKKEDKHLTLSYSSLLRLDKGLYGSSGVSWLQDCSTISVSYERNCLFIVSCVKTPPLNYCVQLVRWRLTWTLRNV